MSNDQDRDQPNERSSNLPKKAGERQDGEQLPTQRLDITAQQVDLSHLTEEQKQELTMRAAEAHLDSANRQTQLGQDVNALDASLQTMARNTQALSESGQSVTITNVRDDNLGHTEVVRKLHGHVIYCAKHAAARGGRNDYAATVFVGHLRHDLGRDLPRAHRLVNMPDELDINRMHD